jgi:drug/metabolite transporter (DMT)-like permease
MYGSVIDDEFIQQPQYNPAAFRKSVVCGYLWVALSSCVFSIGNLTMKISSQRGVETFQALSARGIVQLILCVILLWKKNNNPFKLTASSPKRKFKKFMLLILHGVTSLLGIAGLFIALKYLSMSLATVLVFTSLLYTAIFGWVWLGEN